VIETKITFEQVNLSNVRLAKVVPADFMSSLELAEKIESLECKSKQCFRYVHEGVDHCNGVKLIDESGILYHGRRLKVRTDFLTRCPLMGATTAVPDFLVKNR
jgi:hypothetical protein